MRKVLVIVALLVPNHLLGSSPKSGNKTPRISLKSPTELELGEIAVHILPPSRPKSAPPHMLPQTEHYRALIRHKHSALQKPKSITGYIVPLADGIETRVMWHAQYHAYTIYEISGKTKAREFFYPYELDLDAVCPQALANFEAFKKLMHQKKDEQKKNDEQKVTKEQIRAFKILDSKVIEITTIES